MTRLLLFSFFLLSLNGFAQTQDVLNTVITNNSEVAIGGILENKIEPPLMDLLINTVELQNTIDDSLVDGPVCSDGAGDKDREKNKNKVKTKTVEAHGYEIVFLAQVNSFKIPSEDDMVVVEPTADVQALYALMHDSENPEQMYGILENYIQENGIRDLSLRKQAEFAAMLGDLLPYSQEREAFNPSYTQGSVSTFTQFTTDQDNLAGVCGDIHAANNDLMKRINPNLEAYTMSYAVNNSQHVISYVADPEDPAKIIMTNYSKVTTKGTDGVSSLTPVNTSMDDIGERVRFFQFKNGKQDHVATFRNDIGSLLYEMATSKRDRGATPNDSRYSIIQLKKSWKKVVTKYKSIEKDGVIKEKQKSFQINNDLIFFRGQTAVGNDVIGIMHKKQKLHNVDENGDLKPGEKFGSYGYMSTFAGKIGYNRSYDRNVSDGGNTVSVDNYENRKYYKVYFTTGKKYVKRIIEKDGFTFDGFVGHQLEVAATFDHTKKGNNQGFGMNTGDGDYSIDYGLKIKKQLGDKNTLAIENKVSNHIGVKDQPSYSDFNKLPSNVKMTTNAFSSKAQLDTKLGRDNLRNTANYVGTKMGGKAGYRIDYTKENGGNIFVSFSTPTGGISKNKVNILPENYTVFSTGGVTPDLLKKNKKVDLFINGNVGYMPTLSTPMNFQTGVKLQF